MSFNRGHFLVTCRLSGIRAFHRLISNFGIKRDIITLLKRYARYLTQIIRVLSEWQKILSTARKDGENYMNNSIQTGKRMFFLTIEELQVLMAIKNMTTIPGYDEIAKYEPPNDVQDVVIALLEKGLIAVSDMAHDEIENNTMSDAEENNNSDYKNVIIEEKLDAWLYIISEATSCSILTTDNKKLIFYFWKDIIVALEIKGNTCMIIWIPFIHLALGQMIEFIETVGDAECVFEDVNGVDGKTELKFNFKQVDNTLLNQITQVLVKRHGMEIRRGIENE